MSTLSQPTNLELNSESDEIEGDKYLNPIEPHSPISDTSSSHFTSNPSSTTSFSHTPHPDSYELDESYLSYPDEHHLEPSLSSSGKSRFTITDEDDEHEHEHEHSDQYHTSPEHYGYDRTSKLLPTYTELPSDVEPDVDHDDHVDHEHRRIGRFEILDDGSSPMRATDENAQMNNDRYALPPPAPIRHSNHSNHSNHPNEWNDEQYHQYYESSSSQPDEYSHLQDQSMGGSSVSVSSHTSPEHVSRFVVIDENDGDENIPEMGYYDDQYVGFTGQQVDLGSIYDSMAEFQSKLTFMVQELEYLRNENTRLRNFNRQLLTQNEQLLTENTSWKTMFDSQNNTSSTNTNLNTGVVGTPLEVAEAAHEGVESMPVLFRSKTTPLHSISTTALLDFNSQLSPKTAPHTNDLAHSINFSSHARVANISPILNEFSMNSDQNNYNQTSDLNPSNSLVVGSPRNARRQLKLTSPPLHHVRSQTDNINLNHQLLSPVSSATQSIVSNLTHGLKKKNGNHSIKEKNNNNKQPISPNDANDTNDTTTNSAGGDASTLKQLNVPKSTKTLSISTPQYSGALNSTAPHRSSADHSLRRPLLDTFNHLRSSSDTSALEMPMQVVTKNRRRRSIVPMSAPHHDNRHRNNNNDDSNSNNNPSLDSTSKLDVFEQLASDALHELTPPTVTSTPVLSRLLTPPSVQLYQNGTGLVSPILSGMSSPNPFAVLESQLPATNT